MLVGVRFMIIPMNRATGSSRVVTALELRYNTRLARSAKGPIKTGNAVGTARIYIRQAKRSCRHCGQR